MNFYTAICPKCARCYAACIDDLKYRAHNAKTIAGWIKEGATVVRTNTAPDLNCSCENNETEARTNEIDESSDAVTGAGDK